MSAQTLPIAAREILAAIIFGLLAAFVAIESVSSPAVEYGAAVLSLAVLVLGAMWWEWQRTHDAMSILMLSGVFFLLAFVIGSLYVWFNPSWGVTVLAHVPFSHHSQMRAQWLCVLGWVGFAGGYWFRLLGFLQIPPLKLLRDPAAIKTSMVLLYVVGWVARIALIPTGLYFHTTASTEVAAGSTTSQIIFSFSLMPAVATAYLGIQAHHRTDLRRLYWLALAAEIAFAIPSGRRVDAVSVLVLASIVAFYTTKRLPVRAIAISLVFALFFVFPILFLYRTSHQNTGYQVKDLQGALETYTGGGVENAMLSGVGSTLNRFSDIELPAGLEEKGRNRYPVGFGGTVPWIVTGVLPHALFPNKPNVLMQINNLAFALELTPVRNSQFAPTQVGDMYLDFGTIGVLLGMFVVGAAYRELNEFLSRRRDSPLVLAIYAALAYTILDTEETLLAQGFAGIVRQLLVVTAIVVVTTWLFSSVRQP